MAKTFAQRAKTITNKYKLRLGDKFDKGDPLALAAMNAELEELQAEQEATREMELPKTTFGKGGKLREWQGGGFAFPEGGTTETFTPHQGTTITDLLSPEAGGAGGAGDDPFKSRVPWIGAATNMIGNLLMNKDIDLPEYEYEEFKPTKARANLVDYTRGREQTLRERDQANALITRSARGTGSQAGLMENIIAGATGTQRAAGTAFNQSLEQEGNINAQIRNQVSQFNAAQDSQAARLNMQNKLYATQLGRESTLFKDSRRQGRIGAVTGAVTGYTKDKLAADKYDQMLNLEMARNPNFNLNQADPTFWRRLAGITDPIEGINFTNTGDTITG